jgi:hypothetical protein
MYNHKESKFEYIFYIQFICRNFTFPNVKCICGCMFNHGRIHQGLRLTFRYLAVKIYVRQGTN